MSDDLNWTLRLSNRLRDRITPLAHQNGLDPANYARHLLALAVQEKATADYQKGAAMQTRVIGGGNGHGS